MSPDDCRHGTPAGCQAHWRDGETPCGPCATARFRSRKARNLEIVQGIRAHYSRAEVDAVLAPWLAMGIAPGAIAVAAGIASQRGATFHRNTGPVRRDTYASLAAVTEGAFHPLTKVYADLTRTRIWSLQAAGHQLIDMPINPRGPWRWRRHVAASTARVIRDYYAAHQHQQGPSAHTRGRALAAGHQPPPAWDDPGTLAWPLGWTQPLPTGDDVDEVTVQRILDGDWRLSATKAERVEVVARWKAAGRPVNELARMTGWKPERYTEGRSVA